MKTVYLSIIAIAAIIGIGFMIIFSVTGDHRTQNINISIENLRDNYTIGEQFKFYVKVTGYGKFCGDPHVVISTVSNPPEIIWSYSGREFIGISCPLRDIQDALGTKFISINKTGTYEVSVPFGDKVIRKEFSIISSQDKPVDYDVPDDFRVTYSGNGFVSLDTQKNLYHPDSCSPPIEFRLDLSQQEKQQIWQSVKDNKFFELGDFITKCGAFENCVSIQPQIVVTLNITANGKTYSVTHHNSYIKTKNDNFDKFENVLETINKIVSQKNQLNNFTGPRCGIL